MFRAGLCVCVAVGEASVRDLLSGVLEAAGNSTQARPLRFSSSSRPSPPCTVPVAALVSPVSISQVGRTAGNHRQPVCPSRTVPGCLPPVVHLEDKILPDFHHLPRDPPETVAVVRIVVHKNVSRLPRVHRLPCLVGYRARQAKGVTAAQER